MCSNLIVLNHFNKILCNIYYIIDIHGICNQNNVLFCQNWNKMMQMISIYFVVLKTL